MRLSKPLGYAMLIVASLSRPAVYYAAAAATATAAATCGSSSAGTVDVSTITTVSSVAVTSDGGRTVQVSKCCLVTAPTTSFCQGIA